MPNNQHTADAELSALLNQAEPPESPDELDETILQYARDNAPGSASARGFLAWLTGRPWVSAVATFSIAMIAISVTLQNFDNEVREQSVSFSQSDIGLSSSDENIASTAQAPGAEPAALQAEQPERTRQLAADSDQAVDGFALADSVTTEVQALEEEIEEQLLVVENRAAPAVASSTSSAILTQPPGDSLSTSVADSTAARRSADATAGVQTDAATIIESNLVASENFPEFLSFMEELLINAGTENDDTGGRRELVPDENPPQRAQVLRQNYEQLLQSGSAESIRSQYDEAASSYSSFVLPTSLEQALELLRQIQ